MSVQTATLPGPPVRLGDIDSVSVTVTQKTELWRRMTLIRLHEQVVEDLNSEGLIRGSTHLYIGMEAGAVGAVAAMSPTDVVVGYYRSHGHALALGVPVRAVISEILGRVTGCCGGRGGTKHLMDVSRNYAGAYAIVGQQVALATGVALAVKRAVVTGQRQPSIVTCFFGDGASNQGVTFEALNLAAVLELPCLFVCENNRYAVSTAARYTVGGGSIAGRAAGFGIPGEEVDGMNVLAVHAAVARARNRILDTGLPSMLEFQTYRYRGHSVFQTEDEYRDAGELERYRDRDPIQQIERELSAERVTDSQLATDRDEIARGLREEAEWAKQQPLLSEVSETEMQAVGVRGLADWGTEA